jgi:hypothetical protein
MRERSAATPRGGMAGRLLGVTMLLQSLTLTMLLLCVEVGRKTVLTIGVARC